jgi:hypothetical protein
MILMGKLKYWEKILSQCHFIHHKSYMYWPGIEPRHLWCEASDHLSMALDRGKMPSKCVPKPYL